MKKSSQPRRSVPILILALAAILSACGGSSGTGGSKPIAMIEMTTVYKNISDFELNLDEPNLLPTYKGELDRITKAGIASTNIKCAKNSPWFAMDINGTAISTPPVAMFVDIAKTDVTKVQAVGFQIYREDTDLSGYTQDPAPMRTPWLDRAGRCSPSDPALTPSESAASKEPGKRVRIANTLDANTTQEDLDIHQRFNYLRTFNWPAIKTVARSRQEWMTLWNTKLGRKAQPTGAATTPDVMPEFDFNQYTLVVITGLRTDRGTWIDPVWERNSVVKVRTAAMVGPTQAIPEFKRLEEIFFQIPRTSLPVVFEEILLNQ